MHAGLMEWCPALVLLLRRISFYCSVRGATPQTSHKQAIADTNRGMGVNYRRYDS
jgi:hypothetical protein